LLDERLRRAGAAAALADMHDARRAPCVAQHAVADEIVHEQHGRSADRADCLQREQLRIAGTGADQVDDGRHADSSFAGTCVHAASARRMQSTCCVSGAGAGFSPLTTDWMYTAVLAASVAGGSTGSSVSTPSW